jgi:pimeloyl-ACP methyl ester carboxylesterase
MREISIWLAAATALLSFVPVRLMAAELQQPGVPTGAYADLPGVRIWYTDSGGGGQAIVLLHPATGNTEIWQHNVPGLAAAGYRVITYDRRGWGRSIADPATGPQPGTGAEDLDALADHLGLDRFHLLGIAAGGSVAYDYALYRPERLRSLTVAVSGGGGLQDPTLAEMRARAGLPDFEHWPVEFKELGLGYIAHNPEEVEHWLDVVSRARQPDSPNQPSLMSPTFAKLETLAVPTMIMAGDADLTNPPWVVRLQAEHIPGSRFVMITEVGHAINWERPDAFNKALLDFIVELP